MEAVPSARWTPYLTRLREHVLKRLADPGAAAVSLANESLGKAADLPKEIQAIRDAVAAGQWARALKQIEALRSDDSPAGRRVRGLAELYRGVVFAEAGLGREPEASEAFRQAIKAFADGRADDRFRAHNNFAGFLLNRAQDRLFNHAFQMAAGVHSPFYTALTSWIEARQHYQSALTFAAGAEQKAAVLVNLAQMDALLADVIATLDAPIDGQRRLADAEQAAVVRAREQAVQAGKQAAGGNPQAAALAAEIQAHLAFRRETPRRVGSWPAGRCTIMSWPDHCPAWRASTGCSA